MSRLICFCLVLCSPMLAGALPAQSPNSVLREGLDGTSLVPGTWTYDVVARVDREEQRIGTRALIIEPATHAGRPAWRIIEASWTGGTSVSDTLLVDRTSLRPLRRALHMGSARLMVTFSGDSARGSIQSGSATTAIATLLPPNSVINAGMLEALLRVDRLGRDWSATADLAVIGGAGHAHVNSTALAITGGERITVPAGTFETWVAVSNTPDGRSQTLWLSRDGGWLVRSVAPVTDLPGAILETVLVGHASAPK